MLNKQELMRESDVWKLKLKSPMKSASCGELSFHGEVHSILERLENRISSKSHN